MYVAWEIIRKNWRSACSHNAMITVITETWWGRSHDWNAVMDSYMLFRKDRSRR